jgi:hypothetical protein
MSYENLLLNMAVKMDLLKDASQSEQGQDLIEYALVVAFIAFAARAGYEDAGHTYQRCVCVPWHGSDNRYRLSTVAVSQCNKRNSVVRGELLEQVQAKRGNRHLRKILIHGARAVVLRSRRDRVAMGA